MPIPTPGEARRIQRAVEWFEARPVNSLPPLPRPFREPGTAMNSGSGDGTTDCGCGDCLNGGSIDSEVCSAVGSEGAPNTVKWTVPPAYPKIIERFGAVIEFIHDSSCTWRSDEMEHNGITYVFTLTVTSLDPEGIRVRLQTVD